MALNSPNINDISELNEFVILFELFIGKVMSLSYTTFKSSSVPTCLVEWPIWIGSKEMLFI